MRMSDYLVALASGASQGSDETSARVAELTGLPPDIVRRNFARISPGTFIKEFDRAHGQVLSRYDGSVSGPDPSPSSDWPRGPDPVLELDRAALDERLRAICTRRTRL